MKIITLFIILFFYKIVKSESSKILTEISLKLNQSNISNFELIIK